MGFSKEKEQIKEAFEKIKQEFSDHLEAINSNTNEIQTNFEHQCETEKKIEKLNERVDEICIFLEKMFDNIDMKRRSYDQDYEIKKLTKKEKEIFLLIYKLDEKGYTTYDEVAKNGGYEIQLVQNYIKHLIAKGIPICKQYANNTARIYINHDFKILQTKFDIIGINKNQKKVSDYAF